MMRNWTMPVLAAVTSAALLTGCNGGGQDMQQAAEKAPRPSTTASEPVEIVAHAHGDDSTLQRATVRLIKTPDELAALGLDELPGLEPNFGDQDVIVFALGEQPTGGYWVHITGIQRVGEVLYVQAQVNRPADDAAVTQAVTHPYCAVVVPGTRATRALSDPTEVVGEPMPE